MRESEPCVITGQSSPAYIFYRLFHKLVSGCGNRDEDAYLSRVFVCACIVLVCRGMGLWETLRGFVFVFVRMYGGRGRCVCFCLFVFVCVCVCMRVVHVRTCISTSLCVFALGVASSVVSFASKVFHTEYYLTRRTF